LGCGSASATPSSIAGYDFFTFFHATSSAPTVRGLKGDNNMKRTLATMFAFSTLCLGALAHAGDCYPGDTGGGYCDSGAWVNCGSYPTIGVGGDEYAAAIAPGVVKLTRYDAANPTGVMVAIAKFDVGETPYIVDPNPDPDTMVNDGVIYGVSYYTWNGILRMQDGGVRPTASPNCPAALTGTPPPPTSGATGGSTPRLGGKPSHALE
jgi:hypothetical protein